MGKLAKLWGHRCPPRRARPPESPPQAGGDAMLVLDGDFLAAPDIKMHFYEVQ